MTQMTGTNDGWDSKSYNVVTIYKNVYNYA